MNLLLAPLTKGLVVGFSIAAPVGPIGVLCIRRSLAQGALGVRFGRMFLHAHQLALGHPVSGRRLALEAPLPPECHDLLDALAGAR